MPLILRALRRGMQRSVSTMCAQVEALYVVMSTCCRILKKYGFLGTWVREYASMRRPAVTPGAGG